MQLKKLSDTHYIVVSDEPIEVGNYIMNIERNHIYPSPVLNEDVEYRNKKSDVFKKITHSTQPLRGGYEFYYGSEGKINLQEVKELVGEVDVEKKADEYFEREMGRDINDPEKVQFNFHWRKHFINSYNQCLEDNKHKKFTWEDMYNAILFGIESLVQPKINIPKPKSEEDEYWEYEKNFIESLAKPKDTWEVEMIDRQLKLK